MKKQIEPKTLKGFRDFLPQEMLLREKIAGVMKGVFESFGYDPIENPALEYAKILKGKAGEEEQLAYFFKDLGGREVGLRYDQTVPLARFVAQYQNELPFPFKRYQLQKVWRADKPQRGRYREFYQFDFDIVGPATRLADAEIAQILWKTMSKLGFEDFRIRINNRKILRAYASYLGAPEEKMSQIYRAIDKLEKFGPEGVRKELIDAGIAKNNIEKIFTTILCSNNGPNEKRTRQLKKKLNEIPLTQEGLEEVEAVLNLLQTAEIPKKYLCFDPTMVRGLDYYTGIIFEVEVTEGGIGSVGGGGRYDELLGVFTRRKIAATGIGWGFERLVDIIRERGMLKVPKTNSQVLVTIFSPDSTENSLKLANRLRSAGINTEIYLDPEADLRDQLAYANQKGIPYVTILGPEEIEQEKVALKDLKSGKQQALSVDEAIASLKNSNRL